MLLALCFSFILLFHKFAFLLLLSTPQLYYHSTSPHVVSLVTDDPDLSWSIWALVGCVTGADFMNEWGQVGLKSVLRLKTCTFVYFQISPLPTHLPWLESDLKIPQVFKKKTKKRRFAYWCDWKQFPSDLQWKDCVDFFLFCCCCCFCNVHCMNYVPSFHEVNLRRRCTVLIFLAGVMQRVSKGAIYSDTNQSFLSHIHIYGTENVCRKLYNDTSACACCVHICCI